MSKSSDLDKKAKAYILSTISAEGYDVEINTAQQKVDFVMTEFKATHQWDIDRRGEQTAFADYLSALPSTINIDYENYRILEIAIEWGSLSPNASEKEEDKILSNWWVFIAAKFLQLTNRIPKELK